MYNLGSATEEVFSIKSWLTIQTFRHKETSKSDRIVAVPLSVECRHVDLFLSQFRKTEHTQSESPSGPRSREAKTAR